MNSKSSGSIRLKRGIVFVCILCVKTALRLAPTKVTDCPFKLEICCVYLSTPSLRIPGPSWTIRLHLIGLTAAFCSKGHHYGSAVTTSEQQDQSLEMKEYSTRNRADIVSSFKLESEMDKKNKITTTTTHKRTNHVRNLVISRHKNHEIH